MRKNILIIEDEENARKALVNIAKECNCEILETDNSSDAYKYAMEMDIDVFLIDIILNKSKKYDTSGMVFAQRIRQVDRYKYTPIIFITSLIDEGLNALHTVHCYNYIEKPFDAEKVKENIIGALGAPNGNDREISSFTFHKDGVLYHVSTDDIMYYETRVRKSFVHMVDGRIMEIPYKSSKSVCCELPRKDFIQCNGNTIVNRRYMKITDRVNRYIILTNGEMLEISRIMKKNFFDDLLTS